MDDRRAILFTRLDHPLKSDRMVLRHRRSHDQDGVGVGEVLLRGRRAATPERRPQTGDGGAMSYPGLVADAKHAQTSREKFFDEVVLFVVERGAAEVVHPGGVHEPLVKRAAA